MCCVISRNYKTVFAGYAEWIVNCVLSVPLAFSSCDMNVSFIFFHKDETFSLFYRYMG